MGELLAARCGPHWAPRRTEALRPA